MMEMEEAARLEASCEGEEESGVGGESQGGRGKDR